MILVSPSLPENVGMVARAIRAFGQGALVLVGGVSPSHPQARAAAAGAWEVLDAARQVTTLSEALEGVGLAIGTTARHYERPDLRVVTVREAAGLAAAVGCEVAWVLGTEKHGLAVRELQLCHQVARIPAPGPSLNLAQAAAICLYESRVAADAADAAGAGQPRPGRSPGLAPLPAWMPLPSAEDLASWLQDLGVARERDASSKAHSLLRLSSRLEVDEHESALLRAIAARLLQKDKGGPKAAPRG